MLEHWKSQSTLVCSSLVADSCSSPFSLHTVRSAGCNWKGSYWYCARCSIHPRSLSEQLSLAQSLLLSDHKDTLVLPLSGDESVGSSAQPRASVDIREVSQSGKVGV